MQLLEKQWKDSSMQATQIQNNALYIFKEKKDYSSEIYCIKWQICVFRILCSSKTAIRKAVKIWL